MFVWVVVSYLADLSEEGVEIEDIFEKEMDAAEAVRELGEYYNDYSRRIEMIHFEVK